MTVSKEQAMAMFDHDLDGFMNEVRGCTCVEFCEAKGEQ
jgi:hypothetical protein